MDRTPLISIVIPTYGRDEVLVETVRSLLALKHDPAEILVMDQTAEHAPEAEAVLQQLASEQKIRWVRLQRPSIPAAMNEGLRLATSPLVLFLDDDIAPLAEIVRVHAKAHESDGDLWATVGQVIQPWQAPTGVAAPRKLHGLKADFDFPFYAIQDDDIRNVMAGNLCVHRERALAIGGFDENFVGAAYRFETEFARRMINAGGKIRFLGAAGIRHLRVASGGTRSAGSHLTSASPKHGFGDHYYAFLHGNWSEAWAYSLQRVLREVMTRFHATHPWWIPVKLFGEVRALWSGRRAAVIKKRQTQQAEAARGFREEQPV